MKRFSTHLLVFIFACFFQQVSSQTLIINEVSNGPSGNQEYVELVVASTSAVVNCSSAAPPCIDIRGWIFDDNSGYHGSSGVASGAVRFSQNVLWSCVPIGTIILIYNNSDRNPAIPADDLSLSDGNCRIIAPLSSTLFESNNTTPGAMACSYPPAGWTAGGSWSNTLFANPGDCARIVNLAGCEVFSVCWGSDNLNNLIYMSGSGAQRAYYFNGGNPVIQSNWSFGSTTPSPGVQTPGAPNNAANAAYISQFNNGCAPITPIHVTATAVNAGCTCNGSATATATGSIPGYTYAWYSSAFVPVGQTTATASGLCAGIYNVVATSSTGCSDTANVTITSAAAAASVTVNSQTVCAGSSTTLTASPSVTGGTYLWAPGGQTTQTISLNPATGGTYTVTYTFSGCSSSATGSVTVTPLPVVSVNSTSICNGSTAGLTANGASTYTWSPGATATGVATANVTPSSTATYTVTGTTSGCSATAVSTVTVNPAPVTTVDSAIICGGTTAVLTAGGAASYTWSAGATPSGTATATATPAATTTYTVTGTAAGCSSTAVALVTISMPFSVNAGADDSVCFGGNTSLSVLPNGPGYSYLWSSAATLTGSGMIFNPTASPAITTTYSVVVTDPDGCTGSDSVTVYVDAQIDLTAISSLPASCNGVCNGQTNIIPAGGSGIYIDFLWSSGCTTASCIQCAGPDTVTVTDSWGCSAANSITVIEPSALTTSIGSVVNASCFGACDGTATVTAAGGTTGYTFSWNIVPAQNTATATGLCAGNYTCSINDAQGCSATATVSINEPTPVVILPLADAVICNSGNTMLNAMAGGGNSGIYSYAWSPSTGLSNDTISNPTAAPASTTAYILNVADGNGCAAAPDTVIVTVNSALAIITGGNAVICSGNTALISAAAISGSGSYNYSWTPVSGLSNPLSNAPAAAPASTTTYTVTVTDGCSAPAIDSVIVMILPAPLVNISSSLNSGCAPVCVNLDALSSGTGTDTIHQWNWAFSDGGNASIKNPSYCFNDPGTYDVSLTVFSVNGCSQTITSIGLINVFSQPIAGFTSNTQETDLLNPGIQFTDQSSNATTFNWNFGDLQFSSQPNPEHAYSQQGTYLTTLIVTSQQGCTDSVTHEIVINGLFTFYAPNAFSPNGDHANELFLPAGEGWKPGAYELSIFDRWGNICFSTTDANKGWDGKVKKGSETAQQDVYVWKVMLTDVFNENHIYTGSVTIVK